MENETSLWINGRIYTARADVPSAPALVVRNGEIAYAGDAETSARVAGNHARVVNLDGACMLPGLNDAHLHFLSTGLAAMRLDAHWKPKDEILAAVREAALRAKPGEWIMGWGWNQEVWNPAEMPTRQELDAVSPDAPAALTRTCGHMLWVNSRALGLAGIDRNTPDPFGGEYLRDGDGSPTGVMSDTAMGPIYAVMDEPDAEKKKKALKLAQARLFEYGVTSVSDAGEDEGDINLIESLYAEGTLKIRIDAMFKPRDASLGEMLDESKRIFARGPQTGLCGGRLRRAAFKLLADGSFGARSAWMLDDYSDQPGHRGKGIFTDEELYTLVREAFNAGFQVSVHAIGDAANRQVLDAYEHVMKSHPGRGRRLRVEHAAALSSPDIGRFAKLGVIPSMQTVHAESDREMARARLGARCEFTYAWRKLLATGVKIPNGTDSPVEPADPWRALHSAVTGAGFHPEERMTRDEALMSYTAWPAYAQFEEKAKGTLAPGQAADFTIIDNDFMTCPEDEIRNIKTLETVVGGETVFRRRS
ncbi:MAG: amidohydrolase [Synergistaceae bacterium]|jgi:predicted amidohydrolase YtcJ|nr:amidohydrolase [Synergistaceae bacterium]